MNKILTAFGAMLVGTVFLTSCIPNIDFEDASFMETQSSELISSENFLREIEFTDGVEELYFCDLKMEVPEWATVLQGEKTVAILCNGVNGEDFSITIYNADPSGMQDGLNEYLAVIALGSALDGYKSKYESVSFGDVQNTIVNDRAAYYVAGELDNSFATNDSFKFETVIFESSESIYALDFMLDIEDYEKLYPYYQRVLASIQEVSEAEREISSNAEG